MSGAKNHTHSNYARTIVNSLIVARYEAKRDTAIMSVLSKASAIPNNASTIQTFNLQVHGQAPHQLPGRVKNFYPDLAMVGKHFLVQEQAIDGTLLGSARQYTVATTMEPALYKLLTDALNNDGVSKDAIVERIENNRSSNELSLTLKNY